MNSSSTILLSIISPVYRAAGIVDELVNRITASIAEITPDFEIILVDDGSPDHSWEKILENCQRDERVKGVQLSRNFGQHYAITAGMKCAMGEWVVIMDCDLQDRPEEIQHLYKKALEGYDLVLAQRVERKDHFLKKLSSKLFYKVLSYLTDTKQDATIGNFGIYRKQVIEALLSMGDYIRYFPTQSQWVGFRRAILPVAHSQREEGKSTYTWRKLFELAFNNMVAFSDKPLWLAVRAGAILSLFSFCMGVYYLIEYMLGRIIVLGYASLVISLWFVGGITIFFLGVTGIYISKIFEKVKDRPLFIIRTKVNF